MVICDLLACGQPRSPVLLAEGREPLDYSGLAELVESTVAVLTRAGARHMDRVAVILPNGPELAAAFFAISASFVFAPLNPAYSEQEFEFYLADLEVRFLITQAAFCDAATRTADRLGISVVVLKPDTSQAAGSFTLETGSLCEVREATAPAHDDAALLLHTSGTTARPKLIPLTHRNLTSSASNVAATLALSPADRCLNVMPLFHIHGLVGALLSSVAAGASVFCTTGFNALQFYRVLHGSRATWYTAVPTMHQMILSRQTGRDPLPALRFVRSSSAHLHPKIGYAIEERFQCPALNSYGMTEASHQVTSNPLPPHARKHGTVGYSQTTCFAVLDHEGVLQPAGATGEIAIRGEAVMAGYLVPAEANAPAFHQGWFRTGDLGAFDQDGYLTVTGRIKEIINCGGEKVSPAEIDAVLLSHRQVASAVCFAVACPDLGERICAAVTLAEGAATTEAELKAFVRDRIAKFKVPRQILIVPEIPRGATGKVQRIGMAHRLGLH